MPTKIVKQSVSGRLLTVYGQKHGQVFREYIMSNVGGGPLSHGTLDQVLSDLVATGEYEELLVTSDDNID